MEQKIYSSTNLHGRYKQHNSVSILNVDGTSAIFENFRKKSDVMKLLAKSPELQDAIQCFIQSNISKALIDEKGLILFGEFMV